MNKQQPGDKKGAGTAPLREQLQGLVKQYGRRQVYEALMGALRRDMLGQAAYELGLVPHTAEGVKTINN